MIQGTALSILLAIIVITFFVLDFYFMFRYDSDRKQNGKGWAWDYTVFTIILGLIILLQPILLPKLSWYVDFMFGLLIQIIGGVCVIMSFALHVWARTHLRHFYTERVEVQDGHRVIDSGPYSMMRHPVITSFFLLAGGLSL